MVLALRAEARGGCSFSEATSSQARRPGGGTAKSSLPQASNKQTQELSSRPLSRDASPTHAFKRCSGPPNGCSNESVPPASAFADVEAQLQLQPRPAPVVSLEECPSFAFQCGAKAAFLPGMPSFAVTQGDQHFTLAPVPSQSSEPPGRCNTHDTETGSYGWDINRSALWNMVEHSLVQHETTYCANHDAVAVAHSRTRPTPFACGHVQHGAALAISNSLSRSASSAAPTSMQSSPHGLAHSSLLRAACNPGATAARTSLATALSVPTTGGTPIAMYAMTHTGPAKMAVAAAALPGSSSTSIIVHVGKQQPAVGNGGPSGVSGSGPSKAASSQSQSLTSRVLDAITDVVVGIGATPLQRRITKKRVRAAATGASLLWFVLSLSSLQNIDFQHDQVGSLKTLLDLVFSGPNLQEVARDMAHLAVTVGLAMAQRSNSRK